MNSSHMTRQAIIRWTVAVVFLIGGIGLPTRAASGQVPPDGMALLRGVEQARTGLRAGTISLRMCNVLPNGKEVNTTDLMIEFKGDKRTVRQNRVARVVPAADRAKAEAQTRPGQPFPEGIGKITPYQTRSGWDGTQYCTYTVGIRQCDYRPIEAGTSNFMFDPRAIGIDQEYLIFSSIRGALRLDAIKDISPPVRDAVGGVPVWRIGLTDTFGSGWEFWVEDTSLFRVHRVKYTSPKGTETIVTESTFSADDPKAVLPVEAITRSSARGKLKSTGKAVVTKLDNGEVAAGTGSIGSLDLPVGTIVFDVRIQRQLGWWDGQGISAKIVDTPRQVVATDGDTQLPTPTRSLRTPILVAVAVGAVAAAGVALLVRRGASKNVVPR